MLAAAGMISLGTSQVHAGIPPDCDLDGISDSVETSTETLHWIEEFSSSDSLDAVELEDLWRLNLANDCDSMNAFDGFSASGDGHLIFNSPNDCTFDYGEFNSSATIQTDFYLPFNMRSASLRWWSRMDTDDDGCNYDNGSVEVRGEFDPSWNEVFYDCDDYHPWRQDTADLFPWIGQRISVRYRFETFDDAVNEEFGWAVDDVAIYSQSDDCNENGVPDSCEFPYLFASRLVSPSFVPTGGDAVVLIRFSEPVTGVDLNSFIITENSASTTGGTSLLQIDPSTYQLTLAGLTGEGSILIEFRDANLITAVDDGAPFSLFGTSCGGKFPSSRELYNVATGCASILPTVRDRIQQDDGVSVTDAVPQVYFFTGGEFPGEDACDGGGKERPAQSDSEKRPRGGPPPATTSISDGGDDLFDCGNYLFTELAVPLRGGGQLDGAIPYTFGDIVDGEEYFGPGSQYMTIKVPGLFMMGAAGISANYFWVEGNMGADGEGFTSVGNGTAYGQNGSVYGYFYRHWFEDENCDAQQTQAFVWRMQDEFGPTPEFYYADDNTNDQYQEIAELDFNGIREVYYFNVAHYDPSCDGGKRGDSTRTAEFTTDTLELIMGEFIGYLGSDDCNTSCTTEVESIEITGDSPTNADLVGFEVTFSTSVTGFDASDVAVVSSGPTFGTVSVTGGPQVWTVEIDGVDGDGDLSIGILNDGSIMDEETSETLCEEEFEDGYLIDNTAPQILNCPTSICAPCNYVGKGGPALDFPFVPAVLDVTETEFVVEPPGPYGLNDGYPHEVTVTVTDEAGNSATCTYMVEVLEFFLDPIRMWSDAQRDGHVLSGVPTNVPPILPVATATGDIFYVGDNSQRRQYAGIVHFQTGDLPAVENIRRVTVGLTRVTSAGNVNTLGGISFDMAVPAFGASDALAGEDFDAAATASDVMFDAAYPAGNLFRTYWELSPDYYSQLVSNSSVQFRAKFDTATDNDALNDFLAFRSGNTTNLREAPIMIIEYIDPNCVEYPLGPVPEGGELQTVVLYSTPNEDGYAQEHHQSVGLGGSYDRGAGSFQIGDTGVGRGLYGILNFDTGSLPFDAAIISAELRMYCTSVIGDPNQTMGPVVAQMRLPFLYDTPFYYGSSLLMAADDFESHSHIPCAAVFPPIVRNQYARAQLHYFSILSLNRFGPTQFKIRWMEKTDGDVFSDMATFLSGNSTGSLTARPALIIQYVLGQGQQPPRDPRFDAENPYGIVPQTGTEGVAAN